MSESVDLLRAIDSKLERLLALIARVAPKRVATDSELNSPNGDPQARMMPKSWKGASYVGRRYSECPAALLDALAEMHDYFAERAEAENKRTQDGKPTAPFEHRRAALARGWSQRKATGAWPDAAPETTADDAAPFPSGGDAMAGGGYPDSGHESSDIPW